MFTATHMTGVLHGAGQYILVGCDMYTPLDLYNESAITKSISLYSHIVNQNPVCQEPQSPSIYTHPIDT